MRYLGSIVLALLIMPLAVLAQDGDKMAVPANYRDWVFLTSSLDLNYATAEPGPNQRHMLDNVFVNPEAYKAFQHSGFRLRALLKSMVLSDSFYAAAPPAPAKEVGSK